jgi:hypothetical protein
MASVHLRVWDHLNRLLMINLGSNADIQANTPPSIALVRSSAKLPVCIPR